jgi:hypothetical protein
MTRRPAGWRFRDRLARSAASRAAALARVRQLRNGWWVARIGGPVRGTDRMFTSRRRAEAAVNAHYNRAMMRYVEKEVRHGEQAGGAGAVDDEG